MYINHLRHSENCIHKVLSKHLQRTRILEPNVYRSNVTQPTAERGGGGVGALRRIIDLIEN